MSAFLIKATLTLVPSAEGGRSTPIYSGYRPDWDLGRPNEGGLRALNCGQVLLRNGVPLLAPGTSALVDIEPLAPKYWQAIESGTTICCYEGRKLIGRAVVESLVVSDDTDFIAAAARAVARQTAAEAAKRALPPAARTPLVLKTLKGLIHLTTPETPDMIFFLVPDVSGEEFAEAVKSDAEDVPNVDLDICGYVRIKSLPPDLQNQVRKALRIT